ncbi:transposase [Prevotella nigrescens]|nr:transposase [Prevotella nigrescens]
MTIIEHDGCKIIIDLGSNFPGSHQEELSREDIDSLTAGANALFYTHYHGGYTGLHHLVRPEVSQYIGEGVKDVMTLKYEVLSKHDNHFADMQTSAEQMKTYVADQSIENLEADKIKVTPYFVCLSAFRITLEIGNNLHWLLAATFDEDSTRKRKNTALNFLLFCKFALMQINRSNRKGSKKMKGRWKNRKKHSLLGC